MTLREKVAEKLDRLGEYVGYLRECQKRSLDELKRDPFLRGAVERYLQLSAESVIDVAEMLIAELELRKAEEYKEAIEILGEGGILPAEFASGFSTIAGFRNILVHEYARIDLALVHRHLLTDLDDFDKFSRFIAAFLQR
jgi:uncharacterized protein YutE (UPF0331/DUF86 family)